MKSKLAIVLIAILIFLGGFTACFFLHPILFPLHGNIPVIYTENEIVDTDLVLTLVKERIILHALVDQQSEMIDVYRKLVYGYDKALNMLMHIAAGNQ